MSTPGQDDSRYHFPVEQQETRLRSTQIKWFWRCTFVFPQLPETEARLGILGWLATDATGGKQLQPSAKARTCRGIPDCKELYNYPLRVRNTSSAASAKSLQYPGDRRRHF